MNCKNLEYSELLQKVLRRVSDSLDNDTLIQRTINVLIDVDNILIQIHNATGKKLS
jgi:hypothetical protein